MAISDTQKVDYLWKKLGYGATKTDTNANKFAPNEAIASPLILRGDKVWQQSSSIPTTLPGSSSGVVTVYPTSNPRECTEDITATSNRTWKTGLTDWIPPEIGSTYQAKVYIHTSGDAGNASTGDQVFATGSGNDDEWFFDYQSGVLHFIGTNLPNGISFTGKSVYISGGRYTGTFGVGSAAVLGNLEISDTTITTSTASDNIIVDAETGVFVIEGTTGFVIPVGNTAQRPGSPTTGITRYNSETGLLEIYDGSSWESMGDYAATVDSFDGDNSTTDFVMSAESTTDGTIVDINGVVQLPTTAYTVTGNTISFAEAPGAGDKITTRLLVSLVGTSAQAAGSDTQVQFNDSDALAGDSGFTFNKTTNAVTITGNVTGGNIIATGNVVGTVSGYDIGYRNIPQVASGNVTLALTDSGKHYYSTTSATETITIPPNSSVAFDTGSAIMIVNKGSGTVDIARGSGVALYLAGNSTSANRSVSSYGMATLIKTGTDEWFVSGTGVS